MKKILGSVLLVCLSSTLIAVETNATGNFTISGKLIPWEADATSDTEVGTENAEKSVDLSNARVVVLRDTLSSSGADEFIELISGKFDEGEVNLKGTIDQPTDAKIAIEIGEEEPSTLDMVVAPGANISFVLIEYPPPYPPSLKLFGVSSKVKNLAEKFTISGDLGNVDIDLDMAYVEVLTWEYDTTGEQRTMDLGTVVLKENRFFVEAEVNEPKVVNIAVLAPKAREHAQFHAVIEPGAEITVSSTSSWIKDITAFAGSGKHYELIESWQQSEEYLSTEVAYRLAFQEFQEKSQPQNETKEGGDDSVSDSKEEVPDHRRLLRVLNRLRYDFLEDVAANAEDPIDALLALELGAFWGDEEALPVYDRLSKSLDKDLVARRVTHDRNRHAEHLASIGIDRSLSIGKKVPDFTLPNLGGEQMTLSDLLDNNKLVLVDFWASWCGPCIESIPALKELYTRYREHGFEIVSISVDTNSDDWAERSEELELPWINLGELKGWQGEVATSFGVTFIPKGYVVERDGSIVAKDLEPDKLREFLSSEYGADSAAVD